MAVWQYQLNIIPKKAIIERYGKIPNELSVDKDGWESYWDNLNDIENLPEPNFEDARTIKWWNNVKIDIKETINKIDNLVSRANWGNTINTKNWKGNSDLKEDNDCFLSFDPKHQIIEDFYFRTDMRKVKKSDKFLSGMLRICQDNNLMVYNKNGNLFEPRLELIQNDIKNNFSQ